MYPIDAIKVRNRRLGGGEYVKNNADGETDTNANHQSDTLRSLQWHDTRRISNSHGGGNPQLMARHVERGCWSRLVPRGDGWFGRNADTGLGPAHAVYFATYEAVKHLMGGNQAGVHHPLAAGMCSCFFFCY